MGPGGPARIGQRVPPQEQHEEANKGEFHQETQEALRFLHPQIEATQPQVTLPVLKTLLNLHALTIQGYDVSGGEPSFRVGRHDQEPSLLKALLAVDDHIHRLGKLFILLLTSGEMKMRLCDILKLWLHKSRGIQTTSITVHKQGKTDRGALKVVSRKTLDDGRFRIIDRGEFRDDSLSDVVAGWLKEHGELKRAKLRGLRLHQLSQIPQMPTRTKPLTLAVIYWEQGEKAKAHREIEQELAILLESLAARTLEQKINSREPRQVSRSPHFSEGQITGGSITVNGDGIDRPGHKISQRLTSRDCWMFPGRGK